MLKLEGKVAIITGGTSGIGLSVCELFCKEGATSIIVGRREEGRNIESSLRKKGYNVNFIKCDISNEAEVKAMVQKVIKEYKKIDLLVNSAGIVKVNDTHNFLLKDWDEVFRINLTGAFLCCREVIPYMLKEGKGSIINVSSASGIRGVPKLAAYCASKAGLIMLTKVLALEYGPYGIRTNCVCPGPVDTPMLKELGQYSGIEEREAKENVKKNVPLQRIANPMEIAKVILFLASDESSYVNGSIIAVDGGLTAGSFTVSIGKV
ncbi:Dihydroanticapsin 7-dehydrogenase [archaeon HR06]|nr:Dihydroanticapsin 7-dehydrogenase [archaeon HR06]